MSRNKHPEVTVNRIIDAAYKLFSTKGYEGTSIQDILDELGDLSKGAIYHHFSSKEEIFEAVSDKVYKLSEKEAMEAIEDNSLSGLEKIRTLILVSITSSVHLPFIAASPDILQNPKFLVQHLYTSLNDVAPNILKPIIEEGIEDGSIKGENPKIMAEVLILLLNIWMDPAVINYTKDEFTDRVLFLKDLLKSMGMDIVNEDMMNKLDVFRNILS
ncbi:TetR/AcrR family transcriptional regulator [Anaerofustis stercorihominis]|uniref:TetR/AcrR family transcriptional regulator n=1 Tax=Anaerofustis stercorihominis TaxID=214853 RepID=A0A3E3DWV5_9FIRM|nr:TetR/AcrR family transcriptional regulator [Anaerofustis stercorihominis]RGD73750.1 TetR/AcrR family transcriptional regulator [Anaerofustis stercorihominis]